MATNCTHDCSTCASNCGSREKTSLIKAPHSGSSIKRVIAVASGKGGVGKSLVTSLLAVRAQKMGYRTAILDADITGPSSMKAFGVKEHAMGSEDGILPIRTAEGIKMISMNALLDREDDPVIWRGSLIAGAALQFWTDVIWGDVDIMFIDMPPGTGDVPLSVFQSIPLSGAVIVSTPQDLVEMIVKKAVNMAEMMKVPLLGIVENMSYFICPGCGSTFEIFGPSKAEELKETFGAAACARIPVDPDLTRLVNEGRIGEADTGCLAAVFRAVETSRPINS